MPIVSGVPITLITKDNLSDWVKPGFPIHPAYEYLSDVHKSDYLRAYFMHHYGGGYADIKQPGGSWLPAFTKFAANPNIWVLGYNESGPADIANIPDKVFYAKMTAIAEKLLGNGSYICRSGTQWTQAWIDGVHTVLDKYHANLRMNPAQSARATNETQYGYPLAWTEICGHIFHPLCYKYLEHAEGGLPMPICSNYQ